MEEANRQHQMEIQGLTRGRLDTTDTIIPLKKSKRAERRRVDTLSTEGVAESTASTTALSVEKQARKLHERRVLQSER